MLSLLKEFIVHLIIYDSETSSRPIMASACKTDTGKKVGVQ
jgi:hypothetical protein